MKNFIDENMFLILTMLVVFVVNLVLTHSFFTALLWTGFCLVINLLLNAVIAIIRKRD